VAVIVVLVVIGAVSLLWPARDSGAQVQTIRTAVVKRGDFVRALRVHGVVEAVQAYSVSAPRLQGQRGMDFGAMIITKLIPGGSTVKPGDVLVEFDRQAQLKNALDREADYKDLLEQIKRREAEQASQAANDQTQLKQAENAVKSATLELKKNEVVSKIDAEKNQETLDEAKANFEQLRATFELKRRARQADLRVLQIQRDRARLSMEYARKNAEKLIIKSKISGVVVLGSDWRAGQMTELQEGASVDAGRPVMQIVNPAGMQVRARVNQADVAYLEEGTPVRIGLDAYPDLSFSGTVHRIGAIGVTSTMSARVHTFTALFSIEGSDPRLMPDLSAAVDVELQRVPKVLLLPRDAVVTTSAGSYVVVKNGANTEKRPVKLGPMSDAEAVIEAGVDEGATVLRNPNS
jgi:multidrug efflux pump subunit AcrA (membrane-fusion protein)